ncbi:MAG TPA: hypothetical protein VHM19_04400 [Polyangiales bacterium]|jgi:hypothetical protein|nr:hypothetical protein [Polyangiales bacterium]
MLNPFIIDQIKKREQEERRRDRQPVIELPVPMPTAPRRPTTSDEEEGERGVVIIDLF